MRWAPVSVGEPELVLLRRFVLFYGAIRSAGWVLAGAGPISLLGLTALLAWGCFLAGLFTGQTQRATRAMGVVVLAQLAFTLPLTHNHLFLELFALGLLSFRTDESDRRVEVVRALWITLALVLFQSGLQKILHGLYFQGEFLAFMVGESDRFSTGLALLTPAPEIARLSSYDPFSTGAGPYRVDALPFLAVSNAFYAAELVLPLLLLLERTRVVATALSIALVLSIQLAAREAGFALLYAGLLTIFAPVAWIRPVLVFCALALLAVLVAHGARLSSFLGTVNL